jgi:hypothetical protein
MVKYFNVEQSRGVMTDFDAERGGKTKKPTCFGLLGRQQMGFEKAERLGRTYAAARARPPFAAMLRRR